MKRPALDGLAAALVLAALGSASSAEVAQAAPLEAPIYYFSSCDAGAAAGCVPGKNSNPGTRAAPLKDFDGLPAGIAGLPAGAKLLFARGGSWFTATGWRMENTHATSSSRITFDAYGPADRPLPKFRGTAISGAEDNFVFGWYCSGPCGNATFRNLYVDGLKPDGTPNHDVTLFASFGSLSNVTWDQVELATGRTGIFIAQNEVNAKNLLLKNSHLHDLQVFGFLGGGDHLTIKGNTFRNNGIGSAPGDTVDHHLYLHCKHVADANAAGCSHEVVRDNLIEDTDWPSAGAMVLMHDLHSHLLIEGNTVRNTSAAGAKDAAWGIVLGQGNFETWVEGCKNCTVRRNTVENMGLVGIDVAQSRDVFLQDNTIRSTRLWEVECLRVGVWGSSANDVVQNHIEVTGNTCDLRKPKGQSQGIKWAGGGTGHKIYGNTFKFGNGSATASCYEMTSPFSGFAQWDANHCYASAGKLPPRWWTNTPADITYPRMQSFRDATGFDLTSTNAP